MHFTIRKNAVSSGVLAHLMSPTKIVTEPAGLAIVSPSLPMKHTFIALLMILCLAASAHAADPVKKLASIHDFAFGGIGVAGTISEGEVAFKEVLARPTAEADFVALLDSGNAQARCYALAALHVINPKTYAARVKSFERDKTTVSTIGGCIIMVLPMSSVVATITAGRYDLHVKKK